MNFTVDIGLMLVIVILTAWNIIQFYLFEKSMNRLIDKIMSKNYAEYVQSQQLEKHASVLPDGSTLLNAKEEQAHEDQVLKELNGFFGL